MAAVNFTQKWFAGLIAPDDRPYLEYKDSANPWLILWHRKSGSKTFFASGRLGGSGKFVRIKIPAGSIKGARTAGIEIRTEIQNGTDRRDSKREATRMTNSVPRVEEVWAHYVENHLEKHGKKARSDHSLWNSRINPKWGKERLDEIDPAALARWHTHCGKKSPTMANRAVKLLRRIYTWAAKPGTFSYYGFNPAQAVDGRDMYAEKARERSLNPAEQRRFFEALSRHENADVADIVLFAATTGARRGNLLGARWQDIDLRKKLWLIPAELTKTGRNYSVALPGLATQMLKRRQRDQKPLDMYVFPAPKSEHGHVVNIDKRWRMLLAEAEIADFRLHDLRTFFASTALAGGAVRDAVRSQLGHSTGSEADTLGRHYTQIEHAPRLEAAEIVANMVGGYLPHETGKVVPMRRIN
jgi:integrase